MSSLWYSITYLSVLAKRNLGCFTKTSNPGNEPDKFRRKKCRGDKSSHLHGWQNGGIMAVGSFPIPTRLGRAARSAGRLLFMLLPSMVRRTKQPAALPGSRLFHSRVQDAAQRRLRPPPRLPSMLRLRSAIFPSEEERNCLSFWKNGSETAKSRKRFDVRTKCSSNAGKYKRDTFLSYPENGRTGNVSLLQ